MLKEELRNMERKHKREGVDMTYLKNVILKLLETGNSREIVIKSRLFHRSFSGIRHHPPDRPMVVAMGELMVSGEEPSEEAGWSDSPCVWFRRSGGSAPRRRNAAAIQPGRGEF